MNLAELYTELERHDWFHAMSDSAEVHERGDANWNRLKSEADKIPGGLDLMTNYAKHVFSGEPFGTPKHLKPDKPAVKIKDLPKGKPLAGVVFLHPETGEHCIWHSQWEKGIWFKKSSTSDQVFTLKVADLMEALEFTVAEEKKPAAVDTWVCSEDRPFDPDMAAKLGVKSAVHSAAVNGICPICKTVMNREMV